MYTKSKKRKRKKSYSRRTLDNHDLREKVVQRRVVEYSEAEEKDATVRHGRR